MCVDCVVWIVTMQLLPIKGSYDAILKIIILYIWCNRILTCFNVQKTLFFKYCTLL